jgi:hypothetical protein
MALPCAAATFAKTQTMAHTARIFVPMRMRIPLPTRVGPAYNEIEKKDLREAEFGNVEDVAGLCLVKGRSDAVKLGDGDVERLFDLWDHRLSGPGTTAASDTCRRTRAVFLPWLLVGCAGFRNDQRRHT